MLCFLQVIVNYENADLAPRERAMLDFAMAVCRCDTITEQHFKSLEEAGFDREDAWDIAAIAAFFAMSNRLAHLTDMRPNLEFFNLGRIPRDKSKDKAGDGNWEREMLQIVLGQMLYVMLNCSWWRKFSYIVSTYDCWYLKCGLMRCDSLFYRCTR